MEDQPLLRSDPHLLVLVPFLTLFHLLSILIPISCWVDGGSTKIFSGIPCLHCETFLILHDPDFAPHPPSLHTDLLFT